MPQPAPGPDSSSGPKAVPDQRHRTIPGRTEAEANCRVRCPGKGISQLRVPFLYQLPNRNRVPSRCPTGSGKVREKWNKFYVVIISRQG
jgi:hypothetical protein